MDTDAGSSEDVGLQVLIKQLPGCEDRGPDETKCFPSCVSADSRREGGRTRTGIKMSLLLVNSSELYSTLFQLEASAMCDECSCRWNPSSSPASKDQHSWIWRLGLLVWLSRDQDVIPRNSSSSPTPPPAPLTQHLLESTDAHVGTCVIGEDEGAFG